MLGCFLEETMTKQDADELGRRAVACKHFYWVQGMLSSHGRRVGVWIPGTVCGSSEPEPVWPDLDDPATLGCLLYLVREAWGAERASAWWGEANKEWVADVRGRDDRGPVFVKDTEAEALVAALEAAP
jgi:hypothetical protein